MSANAVRAGKADVEIGVRDKLDKGLKAAAKNLRSFAKSAATIGAAVAGGGAAILAPLTAATAAFMGNGDALSKLSDRTGASVESLGELTYAAEQSGASAEDLQSGFASMAKTLLKGDEESKKTVATLQRMGVSMEELEAMTPDERFTRLADAIAGVSDPTEQAALAARVFGGAGQALLPMLKEGAAGMDALRQRARDLGLVMSGEDAAAATLLGDLWDDVGKIASRLGDIIGATLAPVLIPLVDWFIGLASAAAKWLDANRPLVIMVAQFAVALIAAGAVIVGIAGAAMGLSFVFTGLSVALGMVGTVMAALGTVVGAVLSPLGLIIAAVIAATAAWVTFTDSGSSTLDWLVSTVMGAWERIQAVFGGILAALKSQEWGLAAEIAWESIRLAFVTGVNAAASVFELLGETAGETFRGIAGALLAGDWSGAAAIAWASLKLAFYSGIASVTTAWDEFWTGLWISMDSAWTTMREGLTTAIGWIAKQLVKLWGLFDQELNVDAVIATLEEDTQRKRDNLRSDLESRNGARADALSKELAETEAKLADLRAARQAALDTSAATIGRDPLNADTGKLDDLLKRANALAGQAIDGASKPAEPDVEPAAAAVETAAKDTAGPTGTFSARNLGAVFGPDRVAIDQLKAAQELVRLNADIAKTMHLISRSRAVYAR